MIGHKAFPDRNKYIELGEKYLEMSPNLTNLFLCVWIAFRHDVKRITGVVHWTTFYPVDS
jgi:hypothetical protein